MNREKILDAATIVVLLLAGGVGGLTAWDRFIVPILERRPVPVDDWEDLAQTGHLLREEGDVLHIVEFGDYQCPACRHFEGQLDAFATAHPGLVTVRYRHWPLPQHPAAYPAAVAAECAGDQGYFSAFHESLMDQITWMDAPSAEFKRIADEIAVPDSAAFAGCIEENGDAAAAVEADIAAAKSLGGRGTPTLVINGLLLREVPDSATLVEMSARGSTFATTSAEDPLARDLLGETVDAERYGFAEPLVVQEAPVWGLSTVPTLTIGALEGAPEHTFGFVSGAAQMSNGTIAVVDLVSAEVIMFDDDGSHLRTVGGEGDGPTELRGPSLLPAPFYDSLVVAGNGRVSVVLADGTIYPAGVYQPRELLRGVVPSGIVYQWSFDLGTRVSRSGPRPSDVEVGILNMSSGARTVLGRYSYPHTYFQVAAGRQRAYPMPLRSAMNLVPTPDGVLAVVGNEQVTSVFKQGGELVDSVPLPLPRRRVTSEDISRAIEAELARSPRDQRDRLSEIFDRMPYPDVLPVVERMLPDGDVGVWIELTREYLREGEVGWIVMDARGDLVARVSVPPELELLQIGEDFVIVRSTDELGVQRVHRYDLIRESSGRRNMSPG